MWGVANEHFVRFCNNTYIRNITIHPIHNMGIY
jgi:hypothetical protein